MILDHCGRALFASLLLIWNAYESQSLGMVFVPSQYFSNVALNYQNYTFMMEVLVV